MVIADEAKRAGTTRRDQIRALERADLPRAAAAISGQPTDTRLASFLEEILFDQPWADPELPSLVCVDGGEIVGTIASSTRRVVIEGRAARMVVSAFLWAHPSARGRGVGARLLQALLAGPQDLTFTDGASDQVRRMWELFGGDTVHLGCFTFARVLQPWRFGAERLARRRSSKTLHNLLLAAAAPLDGITRRATRSVLHPARARGHVESLTPASMAELLGSVTSPTGLHGRYDEQYLTWLFEQLSRIDHGQLFWISQPRGRLWCELVRTGDRPIGWYVCQRSAAGIVRVLQIAAMPRDAHEVMATLLYRASQTGASAVLGRVEPMLVGPLRAQGGFVRYAHGPRMLVHARDPSIVGSVRSGNALLSRLDGEWWM